jgi:hypothetical protein
MLMTMKKNQSRDYVSNDNLDIDDYENSVLPWQTQQTCCEKRFMTDYLCSNYAYAAAF